MIQEDFIKMGKKEVYETQKLLNLKEKKQQVIGVADLENPQFEEIFYWPIEKMTNKAFNHLSYNQIITSDYSKPDGGNYELRWKTVIINKIIGGINISLIEGKEIKSKPIAIPPSKEKRIDYILDNFSYIYNSKEDIKQAIKIQVENNKFEIL